MASSGTATVTLPTDTQILIEREFDAPKELVYEAYTKPEHVKRWWAGQRGEVTVAEIDLRVGGKYRYAMIASGGQEVAFNGEFREIVPNERIVNTEAYEGAPERRPVAEHDHVHRGGRSHHPHHALRLREQGGPRHGDRVRHGGRHAGGHGPARADRDLAPLSGASTVERTQPARGRRSMAIRPSVGSI